MKPLSHDLSTFFEAYEETPELAEKEKALVKKFGLEGFVIKFKSYADNVERLGYEISKLGNYKISTRISRNDEGLYKLIGLKCDIEKICWTAYVDLKRMESLAQDNDEKRDYLSSKANQLIGTALLHGFCAVAKDELFNLTMTDADLKKSLLKLKDDLENF